METINYFKLDAKNSDFYEIIPFGTLYCVFYHNISKTTIVAISSHQPQYERAIEKLKESGAIVVSQPNKEEYADNYRLILSGIYRNDDPPILFNKFYPNYFPKNIVEFENGRKWKFHPKI